MKGISKVEVRMLILALFGLAIPATWLAVYMYHHRVPVSYLFSSDLWQAVLFLMFPLYVILPMIPYGRLCVKKGRRPSVWHTFLVTFSWSLLCMLVPMLCFDGTKVFTSDYWQGSKPPPSLAIFGGLGVLVIINFIPAVLTMAYYQRRYRLRMENLTEAQTS